MKIKPLLTAATSFTMAAALVLSGLGVPAAQAKAKTHYCTGIEKDKKVTAKKVIEVRHQKKSGKKSKRDDSLVYLCHKSGKRYIRDYGGWHANTGYGGMSAKKVEGDGKTPIGVFTMGNAFGVNKRPGQWKKGAKKYTKVTKDHVWVDGRGKRKGYNTMQRKSKGYKGESLYVKPAYRYAQVIGYNPKNTKNKGSGIFLHVHTGSGTTAGCVSISKARVLTTYKWQGKDRTQIKIH
nr:L,D-transpeptidase family protein [Brevibacterium sp. 50QC2O2]